MTVPRSGCHLWKKSCFDPAGTEPEGGAPVAFTSRCAVLYDGTHCAVSALARTHSPTPCARRSDPASKVAGSGPGAEGHSEAPGPGELAPGASFAHDTSQVRASWSRHTRGATDASRRSIRGPDDPPPPGRPAGGRADLPGLLPAPRRPSPDPAARAGPQGRPRGRYGVGLQEFLPTRRPGAVRPGRLGWPVGPP